MVELDHTWVPYLAPLVHLVPMLTFFPFRVWESYHHVFAQDPHTPLDLFAGLLPLGLTYVKL